MNKLELLDEMNKRKRLINEDETALKHALLGLILDTIYTGDCSNKCLSTLQVLGTVMLNEVEGSHVYSILRSEIALEQILGNLEFKP